jgi:UDP-glucose 4-epimerase
MVVVVTGAAGFIGSRVAAAFLEERWDVVRAGRPRQQIPSPEFERLFDEHDVDLVVHCAGPASVPASIADPQADRAGSVDVTRALVALLERLPTPPRLLLVSSAAVYGEPRELPVGETAPLTPISPYGRHRLEAEELAAASAVPTTVARVFSAYGEGLRRQVMWDIARMALTNHVVELWGTGAESRDFLHVHDVARALVTIAERATFTGESYNVGSGEETTIAQLADLVIAALGTGGAPVFRGVEREGDPARWRADIGRLSALGWTRSIELADGVARYAAWARAVAA